MTDDIPWEDPDSIFAQRDRLLSRAIAESFPELPEEQERKLRDNLRELEGSHRRYVHKLKTLPDPIEQRRDASNVLRAANVIREAISKHFSPDDYFAMLYSWNLHPDRNHTGAEIRLLFDLHDQLKALESTCTDILERDGIAEWLSGRDFKENSPGHGPVTALVWPMLFHIWDEYGGSKSPTLTRELERFIGLIHEWLLIAEPNRDTLKKAIEAFRKGKVPNTFLDKGIFRSMRR